LREGLIPGQILENDRLDPIQRRRPMDRDSLHVRRPCYRSLMARVAILPYRDRWALANARIAAESRRDTDRTKLAQVAALMRSVDDFGWRDSLAAEDDRVRAMWVALRTARLRG
jgi:hypothetical protein